jgi:hypothetical protein
MALALICLFFGGGLFLGAISLAWGLSWVLAVGYFYGILRANILAPLSHFYFDAAVMGFYAGQIFYRPAEMRIQLAQYALKWMWILLAWPMVLFFIPLQEFLLQVVGLRGNAFLLPFLYFGALLRGADIRTLSLVFSFLNLAAGGFALMEYIRGIESFYPPSAVTEIIYRSNDVAGYTAYRIPAIFVNAHAYGGTMVASLPLIFSAWTGLKLKKKEKFIHGAGIIAACLGVFTCAARQPALILGVLTVAAIWALKRRAGLFAALLFIVALIGWVVSSEERLRRFTTLEDTEMVRDRIAGSVNRGFFDIFWSYPLGNGLAGGGTSIPYFLQSRIYNPVEMENEYSRILSEQGWLGLGLWLFFIAAIVRLGPGKAEDVTGAGRLLAWLYVMLSFCIGMIGVGLMTSIPQTAFFLLLCGWLLKDWETWQNWMWRRRQKEEGRAKA